MTKAPVGALSAGFDLSCSSDPGPRPFPRKGRVVKDSSHGSAFSESGTPGAPCDFSTQVYSSLSPELRRSFRRSRRPAGAPPAGGAVRRRAARAAAVRARRAGIVRAGAVPATVPMWTSRRGWITTVSVWAHAPGFAGDCRAAGVSITSATLMAIARAMAYHADHATGRHCAVTRATIAERLGCDPQTVTRAWRVLRVAGWTVEAARGHGRRGRPAWANRPSVYHLISRQPARAAVHNVDLPPSRRDGWRSPLGNPSPSGRASATAAENSSSGRVLSRRRRRWRASPRPLALQRLADELVGNRYGRPALCHGLHRGHIGSICDALTAAGIDPNAWTGKTLAAALTTDAQHHGMAWPNQIQRPGAFLASRLQRLAAARSDSAQRTADRPLTGTVNGGGVAATGPDTQTAEAPPASVATVRRCMVEIRETLAARSRVSAATKG